MLAQALGGIGLFLLGMLLLTDALRTLAGDALRRVLLRFTGGPWKALFTGTAVTALVQSSSATTLATIGFVGAGLMTFHQALGVIFGANLGTTATGWLVATVGLKFSVSAVALPLVGLGALVRLSLRGRAAHVGMALAGFGMIFVGIDVLQVGMQGLSGRLTPQALPGDGLGGRLALLGLGVVLTTVMQSSSAAMATVTTALHTGGIALPQAAALVIGVNLGTTVTAAIAAAGASLAAKRTALAHLLFNLVTGVAAFLLLPLFVRVAAALAGAVAGGAPATLLAAFHTTFNLIGVALLMPLTRPFADLVERVLAERGPRLTRHLDPGGARMGAIAVEAVRATAMAIAHEVVAALRQVCARPAAGPAAALVRLEGASAALDETRRYMAGLRVFEQLSEDEQQRHLSTLHALDHLAQLIHGGNEVARRQLVDAPAALEPLRALGQGLAALERWAEQPTQPAPVSELAQAAAQTALARRQGRASLLEEVARGRLSPQAADPQIEALRHLDDLAQALARLCERLAGVRAAAAGPADSAVTASR